MTKFLKIILIICIALFTLYTILWFGAALYVSKQVTEQYANQEVRIPEMGKNYSIYFQGAQVAGYPFAFGIKLAKFRETSDDGVVEYKHPIEFGYNFRLKAFYRNFDGQAIARLRPIHSHIGSVIDGSSSLTIKYPITKDAIQQLSQLQQRQENGEILFQEDYLPLLRGLKGIEFVAKDVIARDISNQGVLYESPEFILALKLDNNNEVDHFLPVLQSLPNACKGYLKIDIKDAVEGKQVLVNNMMFGLMLPSITQVSSEFNAVIDLSSVEDFQELNSTSILSKILTSFEVQQAKIRSSVLELDGEMQYGHINKKRNMAIKTTLLPLKNFKQDIITALSTADAAKALSQQRANQWVYLINKYYTANPDKISFDVSMTNNSVNIDKFAIDIGDMGIMLQTYTDWDEGQLLDLTAAYNNFNSRGRISFFNFDKIIDNAVEVAFSAMPELNQKKIEVLKQKIALEPVPFGNSIKHFVRAISEHPESVSPNVVIEYTFDKDKGVLIRNKNIQDLNAEYIQLLIKELALSEAPFKTFQKKLKNKLKTKNINSLLSKIK